MENKFGLWLQQIRETRGLTQSDLARMAHLNRAVINKIENNASFPTPDTLNSIAGALNIAPETIFRAAGLLPSTPAHDQKIEDINHLMRDLNPDDLEEIEQIIRLKLNRKETSKRGRRKAAHSL
jgi:transcriptional regulator with XRE-family HTH domain